MSDLKQSEKSGVGGWLLLLCCTLTIFSPLKTLYYLNSSYNGIAPLFDLHPSLKNLFNIDAFLSIILMILSMRAGFALWEIKQNAVKIAKNYFWIFMVYSVVALFLPLIAGLPVDVNDAIGFAQSLIYIGIWYSYLDVSKRVKATYYSERSE